MRPTIFEHSDDEMAKRNFRPEDAAHFAEGARKAGFRCLPGRPRKRPFRRPLTSADHRHHHVNYTMLQARTLRRC